MAIGEVAERETLMVEQHGARLLNEALSKTRDSLRQATEVEQWTRALRELESVLSSSEIQDVLGRVNAERSLRG